MSDNSVLSKREQELEKIVDELRSTGTLEGIGILQNFADQENKLYLEKVLEEAEKRLGDFGMTSLYEERYRQGQLDLLNHLKQKQRG